MAWRQALKNVVVGGGQARASPTHATPTECQPTPRRIKIEDTYLEEASTRPGQSEYQPDTKRMKTEGTHLESVQACTRSTCVAQLKELLLLRSTCAAQLQELLQLRAKHPTSPAPPVSDPITPASNHS